jgi:hypothetical protein
MRFVLAVTTVFLLHPSSAIAQGRVGLGSAIPRWVDSALTQTGFYSRYQFTSQLNPDVRWGDFDRDGFPDVAVTIMTRGSLRRGIAIIHRLDKSVHIIGAGQPIGNGRVELPLSASWDIVRLQSHHDAVYLQMSGAPSGFVAWTGDTYAWVQDSN